VLPGISTNTTYEDTLQALEDRLRYQHFAATYCCQLTRTQKAGESLQDYIGREAGKAFAYEVEDHDIKIQLLLGGEW
jgi:hypothetical protein